MYIKNRKPIRMLTLMLLLFTISIFSAANARTIVVHLTAYDAAKTTNALLFAKHSCQFLPDADSTTIRILFTNQAAINALKDIKHPKNRIATLPDDDPKTANHLLRQLLAKKESHPALRCNVQVAVTGLALKSIGKTPEDIFNGIKVGGPKPTSDPNRIQVPVILIDTRN